MINNNKRVFLNQIKKQLDVNDNKNTGNLTQEDQHFKLFLEGFIAIEVRFINFWIDPIEVHI